MRTIVLFSAIILGGCCTPQKAFPPDSAPVSQIVDKLKEELNLFANTPPNKPRVQEAAECLGANSEPIVSVVATKAELTLKVTTSEIYTSQASAKIPVGSIVTVNPGFSGSYQTNGTQALTLNLDIQHPKTRSELQSEIENLAKQLDFYTKAHQRYSKDRDIAEAYATEVKRTDSDLRKAHTELANALTYSAGTPAYGPTDSTDTPNVLADHNLAKSLWSLRQNLLNVNHAQQPCVKPNQLKTEVNFEVVSDKKASFGLDIKIVSIGAGAELKRDSVQNLSVTFDMAGGSSTLLLQQFRP